MNTAAILLCGGTSNRMQGKVEDKILAELGGKLVFDYSLKAFEEAGDVSEYTIVYKDCIQRSVLEERFEILTEKPVTWVKGGKRRQASVMNALNKLSPDTDYVLIHDCARPLVQPEALHEVYTATIKEKSACLAHRSIDTIKEASKVTNCLKQVDLRNLDRRRLWEMETPQAFAYKVIFKAYQRLEKEEIEVTDDTAAAIHFGYRITLVENRFPNLKITRPEDLAIAEVMLQQLQRES
tara:strand:+ start:5104 stop:5817 length:714 start_codon:yes stop_codon:yes gene_type:complete